MTPAAKPAAMPTTAPTVGRRAKGTTITRQCSAVCYKLSLMKLQAKLLVLFSVFANLALGQARPLLARRARNQRHGDSGDRRGRREVGNRLGRFRDGRRHQRHARRRRDLRARADRHDSQARGRRQGVHGREPDARRRLRVARCARPALRRRAYVHRAAEHVPAGLQRSDGGRAAPAGAQGARDDVRERRAARPPQRS